MSVHLLDFLCIGGLVYASKCNSETRISESNKARRKKENGALLRSNKELIHIISQIHFVSKSSCNELSLIIVSQK